MLVHGIWNRDREHAAERELPESIFWKRRVGVPFCGAGGDA
jgi:hypothetical protein